MNTRFNQKSLMIALVMVAVMGVSALVGTAFAQGTFSNASLHGTYAFVQLSSPAGRPVPDTVWAGLTYFDGQGNYRFTVNIASAMGEPDEEGNPTRLVILTVKDPEGWGHFSATYEVMPDGSFIFYRPFAGEDDTGVEDLDGVATMTEMIDGVLTITETYMFGTEMSLAFPMNGLNWFRWTRIADGDILATPPAAE